MRTIISLILKYNITHAKFQKKGGNSDSIALTKRIQYYCTETESRKTDFTIGKYIANCTSNTATLRQNNKKLRRKKQKKNSLKMNNFST